MEIPAIFFNSLMSFSEDHKDALIHKLIVVVHLRDVVAYSFLNCEIPVMLVPLSQSVLQLLSPFVFISQA